MAGAEGGVGGQTELLTGWSYVVHRPSEDPEPSSLPSTVDIAAFSADASVQPNQSPQNDCCSNSDSDSGSDSENSISDASGTCSYSSSDSDSSSSSQASSSSSLPPQFSVTSSQTGGLRLTIQTVRKSCSSPNQKDENSQLSSIDKDDKTEIQNKLSKTVDTSETNLNNVIKNLPNPKLSSSESDTNSDSDSSTNSESQCIVKNTSIEKKHFNKKDSPANRAKCLRKSSAKTCNNKHNDLKSSNTKKLPRQRNVLNSKVPLKCPPKIRARASTRTNKVQSQHDSSSDSDESGSNSESAMLVPCSSLQVICQEDLAAILPDQEECDPFASFEPESRNEKPNVEVDDGSGSDMELPMQLVNAAIQRVTTGTESSSETDSQPATYASTLLQQFVQQQQQLSSNPTSSSTVLSSKEMDKQLSSSSTSHNDNHVATDNNGKSNNTVKRKRGRPRKILTKKDTNNTGSNKFHSNQVSSASNSNNNISINTEYSVESNVSPDSGIQNSPDHLSSPETSPFPNNKTKIDLDHGKGKYSTSSKSKTKYYNSIESQSQVLVRNSNNTVKKSDKRDKIAQKQKIPLTCNNLDRVLYANSDRILYPPRRKVGRPSSKVGVRKPGRPPKSAPIAVNVSEKSDSKHKSSSSLSLSSDVKVNSSKTVGQKSMKTSAKKSQSTIDINKRTKKSNKSPSDNDIVQLTSNTLCLSLGKSATSNKSDISVNSVPKSNKTSGALLSDICDKVTSNKFDVNKNAQQSTSSATATKSPVLQSENNTTNSNCKTNSNGQPVKSYVFNQKPKCIAFIKNTKLNILKSKFKHMKVMHSKHYRKNKKHKIKILKTISSKATISNSKIDTDIEKLISDFIKYCNLGTSKAQKENFPEMFRCVKRLSKKRKGVENTEGRKKKKQTNTNNGEKKETSSNEQRLPLKKRHYHISTNNENKNSNPTDNNTSIEETTSNKDDTDAKQTNNAKHVVVSNKNNTSIVSTKVITEKSKNTVVVQKDTVPVTNAQNNDESPNKSPPQNVANATNKSVLVMNKTSTNNTTNNNNNNNNNNNVYVKKNLDSEDLIGVHIDEAIEACITRYTSSSSPVKVTPNAVPKQVAATDVVNKPPVEVKKSITTITATTPKKRHRLETENIENFNNQIVKVTKKIVDNTAAPVNTTKTVENFSETVLAENKTNSIENVVSEIKNKKNMNLAAQSAETSSINNANNNNSNSSSNNNNNNNNKKYNDKKIETVAQMITRKKNRLEDLTSNLVSKISTSNANEAVNNQKKTPVKTSEEEKNNVETVARASVIKSPIVKKASNKPATEINNKLLDSIVDEKPTGIFLQTVDLELHIPASTIQTTQANTKPESSTETNSTSATAIVAPLTPTTNQHNLRNKKPLQSNNTETANKSVTDVTKPKKPKSPKEKETQQEPVVKVPIEPTASENLTSADKVSTDTIISNSDKTMIVKKKIRRRKAINRTGFPTLKKKKKKPNNVINNNSSVNSTSTSSNSNKGLKPENKDTTFEMAASTTENSNIYDRVPRLDEEATTFMKRTQKSMLSVISLDKLQAKPESVISSTDSDVVSKWEVLSECDSLPMDECVFTSELESLKSVKSERPSSRLDIKQERTNLKASRDISPATSVETRSSDRTKKKSHDADMKMNIGKDDDVKCRTRDHSPDSTQTLNETNEYGKKVKRKRDASSEKTDKRKKTIEDNNYSKRRFRDVSPASSIEPLPSDKKQRSDSVTSGSGDDTKRSKKAPRWRKKYLVAGLFSDFYKEDDESVRARRESATTKRLIYNPSEHPYGLLPPPYHCGKWLRCRRIPFKLPYDLWWQHTHSQLPGRDLVPSWNYRKIRTNVYCVRSTSGACEPQACNCTSSSGCEDDCINRLVLAECPSTHRCRNQRIQKHEWAPGLEKFMTENKGWGVRTTMFIKSGEFILEYVGEVVSDQEFKHRMATRYTQDTHHYCLHLDGGLVIDGHRMGGDGRFVNHSCEPNCEMQKWSVNGQFRMALFALRDIQPNEELTYDYNFSLFNPAEGQVCKCGSSHCRGVIGGKSQRVRQSNVNSNYVASESNNSQMGRVGRPRKNQARKATTNSPQKETPATISNAMQQNPIIIPPQIKPMSHQQKTFARQHHCFLIRNLGKVKRLRDRSLTSTRTQSQVSALENSSAFISQLNALRQPRNMRTRRLAQAEDNPDISKAARLASVLKDLYELITTAKDEDNSLLCSSFMTLASKRKFPEYYQRISEPIDLNTIEQNIATGVYRTVESFDSDMIRLFSNAVRFFGRTSDLGIAATRLRKVYTQGKIDCLSRLEGILGEKAPSNFVTGKDPADEDEDVIRCICGLYRDEGLMIQCERCLVWQHCECVRADPSAASYHCERCVPRKVDLEIPLDEYTEQGHRYYVSLLRGDLQLRQGDTVYVLRDIAIPGTNKKHTYDTIGDVNYTDLDIFRIERLWKDSETGQRFAFGHHYLRPHETYHEPTRKFFPNEVMRVPLYEVVPIELIMSPCWVLDINTYCKGRPLGATEEHVYICEYRVDKTARLFSKISKSKFPICTKSYAFEKFDNRLKISRTYTPHELDNTQVKPRGRRPQESDEPHSSTSKEHGTSVIQEPVPVIRERNREDQRTHLNNILLRLLGRLPTKHTLDASYLLEGGRRRKKQQS